MVVLRDQNHNLGDKLKTISQQGFKSSPIIIGNNVWFGTKSSVLMGSTIGDNTVIGAHSLVRGKIDENSIYVGTPAKIIKTF